MALLPLVFVLSIIWASLDREALRAKSGPFGLFSLWFPLLTTLATAWTLLEAMGRVFTAPPYGLKLRDTVGGHPLDGGILVFNVQLLRSVIVAFDDARSMFNYRLTQLELDQLHVALNPLGSPVAGCEVTVSGELRRGLRKAWTVDKGISSFAGFAGAAAGAGIGLTIALGRSPQRLPWGAPQ
jgi:hypothetical protein